MRIGIIGSGLVGKELAQGLTRLGHDVMIGTRDVAKLKDWSLKHPQIAIKSNVEAAQFGEIVILATLWAGTECAIQVTGPENLNGKVVIDVTNPGVFIGGRPSLVIGFNSSAGELVQGWLPSSRVVKAFNHVSALTMLNPHLIGGDPDMFIAGNDRKAKRIVQSLLESAGWGVIDLGDITMSRYLEPLAALWIAHFLNSDMKKYFHGFKLLNKST